MSQFKKDTLPFFLTQFYIIRQQFPKASNEECSLFLQQLTTLSQTFYQYANIPKEQVQILTKLNTFGTTTFLSPENYFTKILINLTSHLN